MKILKIGFILSAVLLFVFACNQAENANTNAPSNTVVVANENTEPAAAPDEFAEARRIFSENCMGCHRGSGTGGEKEVEGRKIKVPSFLSKGAMNASDEKLYRYIHDGDDDMPSFKSELNDQQIKDLVRFIRREFQKK